MGYESDLNSVGVTVSNAKGLINGRPFGVFSVTEYGAEGDGTADDTEKIRATIAAAGVGGTVYFPAGTYVTDSLTPLDKQKWRGAGKRGSTVLKLKANASGHLISGPIDIAYVHLQGMYLDGNKSNQTVAYDGIHIDDVTVERAQEAQWIVRDVTIEQCKGNGVFLGKYRRATRIVNCNVWHCDGHGIHVNGSDSIIDTCSIGVNGNGDSGGTGRGIYITEYVNRIRSCDLFWNYRGLECALNQSGDNLISGCSFDTNYQEGVLLGSGNVVEECSFRNNSAIGDGQHSNCRIIGERNQVVDNHFTSYKTEGSTLKDVSYHVFLEDTATQNIVRNIYRSSTTTTGTSVRANYAISGCYNRIERTDTIVIMGATPRFRVISDGTGTGGVRWEHQANLVKHDLTEAADGSLVFTRYDDATPTTLLVLNARKNIYLPGGWDSPHFEFGSKHLWIDSGGKLRIKDSAPISDTDGTVVGTQS